MRARGQWILFAAVALGISGMLSRIGAADRTQLGSVEGRLVHSDGRPVPRASITLMTHPAPGQFPVLEGTENTDAKGSFRFGGVPAGAYMVQAQWLSATAASNVSVANGATTRVTVVLQD